MKKANSPSTVMSETNSTEPNHSSAEENVQRHWQGGQPAAELGRRTASSLSHQEVSTNSKFAKKYAVLFYCAMLFVVTVSASGQAGKLDPTFGIGGITTVQNVETGNTNFFAIGAVAIQSDGKIVVAGGVPGKNGFTVPAVLRFLSNGGPDKSFGANGTAVLPNSFGSYGAAAIQPDGKILVATGNGANGELDRFTSAGKLDSSFGSKGAVIFKFSSLSGIALQPDGRILAGVQSLTGVGAQVARLLANGSIDTSFGTNGFAFPPGGTGTLEVLSNGEILVFGGLISRLTSSGAIDAEFGVGGQLMAPNGGHALAANGDILAAGTLVSDPTVPSSGFAAFAYQNVGIGDPAFGKNGGVSTTLAGFPTITVTGIGLESSDAIVELGTAASRNLGAFGLVRYTPQGQLDSSFGSGGTVTTSFGSSITTASAIAIQSDDKIVVAGTLLKGELHGQSQTTLVVARYLGK
jgi:uncharacterized delta-60 repeat protein